ncbi:hypothetical protein [Providencia sneebia]|uniref:Type III secretion protein n=1 Tax=Providencia sneebia DSM 19967 TaxID=1141660 RepID=K8WRL1_9GAMM|nr:hypothetical protein OO7_04539 [Providencia sneebia DSM 19967]
MIFFRRALCGFLLFMIVGCQDNQDISVAEFESADTANKVLVLLNKAQIEAKLVFYKGQYSVYVNDTQVMNARALLSKFNFYFELEDLNDLLESKFSSLSKLENIKGNLLEGREIYNKLNVIPDVLRANVMVTGEGKKRISILLISLKEFDATSKARIEKFLKGIISANDMLTIEYLVQHVNDE